MILDAKFLEKNRGRYLQSKAVKISNRKSRTLVKSRKKIRKQILLTSDEAMKLETLTNHFKLSNSTVTGHCINVFYDNIINSNNTTVANNNTAANNTQGVAVIENFIKDLIKEVNKYER